MVKCFRTDSHSDRHRERRRSLRSSCRQLYVGRLRPGEPTPSAPQLIDPQKTVPNFSDLSIPNTLFLTETLYHTSCSEVITERVTAYISGTTFFANPTIYTLSASGQQFVTYNFPFVTVTSLSPAETLLFVLRPVGFDSW
jgi:hypothetical protein